VIDYPQILQALQPFKDKVFFRGLTENEICKIEKEKNSSFPSYFRNFLKFFGVRQDFVFGLYKTEDDFLESTEYLPDEIRSSFVLIGDNGGEDYWLLNSLDETDLQVYEWQHWKNGEIEPLDFDFKLLLNKSLEKIAENYSTLKHNDQKKWCVQFSIETNDEQLIYDTIAITRTEDWILDQVSPANVYCYKTTIKLEDKLISFSRLEYESWEQPLYFFDLEEPAQVFGKLSIIKQLDNKLKPTFENYSLLDYGILCLADDENYE
jgi:hypothetical protein